MKKHTNLLLSTLFMLAFSYVNAQTTVNTLAELRIAVQNSNQAIVMKPGNYNIVSLPSDSRFFPCSGSNNTIDLRGVYIEFPVDATNDQHFLITGSGNTIRGGVFENTYANGTKKITDYVAYNNDKNKFANGASPHVVIQGNANSIIGIKMTVRGSFPYGYGSIYGINADNQFGVTKRGGIAVQGTNAVIDSCELQMQAFGHAIYIQSPSNHTIIKNTVIVGEIRLGSELLAETDPSSLPSRSNFMDFSEDSQNPTPIDPTRGISLCEDGIRLYTNGGSMHVENCRVEKMRGGIRGYLGSGTTVVNSTAIDCESTNFNLPSGGTITNSYGNFSYCPLSDYRLSRSNTNVELTIIPSPHASGSHNLVDVSGNNHKIVFHRTPGPIDTKLRSIVVIDDNSTITNETEYPIILEATANGNTIISCGQVTDNGTNNKISKPATCPSTSTCTKTVAKTEAECYDNMLGIQTEDCSEGTLNVGWINNGDWLAFDNVNLTGMKSIKARVSGKTNGSTIEVRTGSITGTLIATIPVTNTGGNQTWVTDSVNLSAITGTQNIFLVFKGAGTGYLFNINWFGFSNKTILVTSIDKSLQAELEIYPNPVTNKFQVLNQHGATIELLNQNGKVEFSSMITNDAFGVDMSGYSKGIYFVKTLGNEGVNIKKIIKE